MRPASITSARSASLPSSGSKHRRTADGKLKSVEAAQAMEDLKAETGYASYTAYLESLGYHPAYQGHLWHKILEESKSSNDANDLCAIIDLFKEEASPPKATLRCENLSADQTLQSLRTPPKDVAVQIVLWSISESVGRGLDANFVTVFGLGLKLDPRFFRCLAEKVPRWSFTESAVKERDLPEYLSTDTDGTVIAMARDCLLAKPGDPPVLLIVTLHRLDYEIDRTEFYFPIRVGPPSQGVRSLQPDLRDSTLYTRLLTASMNQNPDCTTGGEGLLLECLLPLLQLDILRMRARCSGVRSTFQRQKHRVIDAIRNDITDPSIEDNNSESTPDDEADSRLYRYRVFLRSITERFEGMTEPLVRFISSQLAPELTTSPAYHRIAEERVSILKEALSLEAEIRDFLQLQAGQLSLLESRKSIEVSIKIFTILAFVYLPLNLATSIFGMNLQQLNGSGKSIEYFVFTALIALIITGGSWWLPEQWSSLRAWRNRDPDYYKGPTTFRSYARPSPNYSILVRAAMLTWLVTRGHSSWMVKSGAGWCTLINSRRICYGDDQEHLFAGDYLSKFIYPDCDESKFTLDVSSYWV